MGVVFPCVGAAARGGEHQSALTLVIRQIALERTGGNVVVHLDDGDLLSDVFQLADVAVPVVGLEQARGVLREHKRRHLVAVAKIGGELAEKQGNVLFPVAQRRHPNLHGVETIVKVFAETSVFDGAAHVEVGGCYHADVGFLHLARSHADELARLQYAQ